MNKFFTTFCVLFLFTLPVSAAEFSLVPEKTVVGLGEKFVVNIFIDGVASDSCVNTVELDIVFPKELYSFVDFFEGESVVSLWIEKPSAGDASKVNKDGKLSLTGGMPGGYCGKIAGDQGPSNLLGRLIFNASSLIETSQTGSIVVMDGARVLMNDGLGTEERVLSTTTSIRLDRDSLSADVEKNMLLGDKIQPEPFSVELHQSASMYNGLYYIIFGTNDKQSGIAYYEALELRPEEELGAKPKLSLFDILFGQKRQALQWKRLINDGTQLNSTTYVLSDQSLQSGIKIKAVDKAGNERVVDFTPPSAYREDIEEKTKEYLVKVGTIGGGALAVVLIMFVVIWWVRRRRNISVKL